jgi:hypothetical protein
LVQLMFGEPRPTLSLASAEVAQRRTIEDRL